MQMKTTSLAEVRIYFVNVIIIIYIQIIWTILLLEWKSQKMPPPPCLSADSLHAWTVTHQQCCVQKFQLGPLGPAGPIANSNCFEKWELTWASWEWPLTYLSWPVSSQTNHREALLCPDTLYCPLLYPFDPSSSSVFCWKTPFVRGHFLVLSADTIFELQLLYFPFSHRKGEPIRRCGPEAEGFGSEVLPVREQQILEQPRQEAELSASGKDRNLLASTSLMYFSGGKHNSHAFLL